MNTKLDNITTQYRTFNDNQVLTDGQLNEFIDYFEDQDRLTRTRAIGVGVANGFKSTIDEFGSITIRQGVGITTDGDLITLRAKGNSPQEAKIDIFSETYLYYRPFKDDLKYPHFNNGNSRLPLIELLTAEDYAEIDVPASDPNKPKPLSGLTNAKNLTIILYLESYSNGDTPCEDADCTNKGDEQIANLRVLLADSSKLESFMIDGEAKDSIYKVHNSYEKLYDALPDLQAKRVILDTDIISGWQLKAKFQDAILSGTTVADLCLGFNKIADTFNITPNYGGQTLYNKLYSLLNPATSTSNDYQYRYDLLKDLLDTYNEIKGLILHLKSECCPSINSFPKHLLLGNVGQLQELGAYIPNRHDFYNAPINTNDDENYQRVILLIERFTQTIMDFQSFSGPIKITPSRVDGELGGKAIPGYYGLGTPLLQKWNFKKTQADREGYNLSYHTTALAGVDFVQNPLKYNLDDYDFFRVEGLLDIPLKVASQTINDIIKQYNLPFKVVTVVLDKSGNGTSSSAGGVKRPASAALEVVAAPNVISVKQLRDQLLAISGGITNQSTGTQDTLQAISKLDTQLKKLNDVDYGTAGTGTSVIKENPKKSDEVSELLSELLEFKPGLEHLGGSYRGGTLFLIGESDQENKVLADFTLPYLCCSKKDPVFLVLPANKICKNAAAMPMTIIPLDGEIKAFSGGMQIDAIRQNAGQNFFTPSLVPNLYLGKQITFTVNDDPVETQIVVHEQPTVTLQLSSIVNDYDNNLATVYFLVSHTGSDAIASYQWNYGDNTSDALVPNASNIVAHVFPTDPNETKSYHTTLTVTSQEGGCSAQASVDLELNGLKAVPCGQSLNFSGSQGTHEYNIEFGTGTGTVGLNYNAYSVPDRFIIEWDGHVVADSRYVGVSSYYQDLINAGISPADINLGGGTGTGQGQLRFNKTKATPSYAKIRVLAPLGGTSWAATGVCANT